ncbi:MAG: SAM-dependent methyltransferase [Bacteroidetes bacterium]|jgi:tRNA (adenine37-N6)-methyltransferase|nr:SAM-dependent methyltransferase [Bacteroidota bacterium]MBT6686444.1 SAM-dependent methyltransferase [Bacteroidota bacterium]MBT7144683.1 SAM-dependent methyltransferase [Bacteroidota bacterium]MBT7491282.1 SAM-dependent methyltransferase [Bacteroidota bacterium]
MKSPENIIISPIAYVRNCRKIPTDDNWAEVISEIELIESLPIECFDGIEQFSHLEIIYHFHKVDKILCGSFHPRENMELPETGIFAQRKKNRLNTLGLCTVNLLKKEGRTLFVSNFDAIDQTPIIDIKPVFVEFLPKGEIKQAKWTKEIMKNYW